MKRKSETQEENFSAAKKKKRKSLLAASTSREQKKENYLSCKTKNFNNLEELFIEKKLFFFNFFLSAKYNKQKKEKSSECDKSVGSIASVDDTELGMYCLKNGEKIFFEQSEGHKNRWNEQRIAKYVHSASESGKIGDTQENSAEEGESNEKTNEPRRGKDTVEFFIEKHSNILLQKNFFFYVKNYIHNILRNVDICIQDKLNETFFEFYSIFKNNKKKIYLDNSEELLSDLYCDFSEVSDDSDYNYFFEKANQINEYEGEEDAVDGEETNGEEANGEEANGEEANGEEANGEEANGEEANGEEANGEEANGEEANGEEADGAEERIGECKETHTRGSSDDLRKEVEFHSCGGEQGMEGIARGKKSRDNYLIPKLSKKFSLLHFQKRNSLLSVDDDKNRREEKDRKFKKYACFRCREMGSAGSNGSSGDGSDADSGTHSGNRSSEGQRMCDEMYHHQGNLKVCMLQIFISNLTKEELLFWGKVKRYIENSLGTIQSWVFFRGMANYVEIPYIEIIDEIKERRGEEEYLRFIKKKKKILLLRKEQKSIKCLFEKTINSVRISMKYDLTLKSEKFNYLFKDRIYKYKKFIRKKIFKKNPTEKKDIYSNKNVTWNLHDYMNPPVFKNTTKKNYDFSILIHSMHLELYGYIYMRNYVFFLIIMMEVYLFIYFNDLGYTYSNNTDLFLDQILKNLFT
ncbi:hypothetical protein, conserved [Plasmodium gonderi]|uniref:Uncharacterized protein n=1 Tax=Plasmodium gonderi TaxID=77519 RepID=A0A1Y1JKZ5_PLAGO|nr:hypothetical protein, conserved [Plasmodium gonderi]GAW81877.1 hypothetical protein, conserved [Plasmodium gonderi]